MRFRYPLRRVIALATIMLAVIFSGCSTNFDTLLPDRRPDYRKSTVSAEPLEVPPDLTSSTIDDTLLVPELNPSNSASLATYASERGGGAQAKASTPQAVLPSQPGITMEQDGNQRWLVISAPADQVWPRVREFWASNGFTLKRDDPTIGIMETDWVENRADIPQDGLRAVLKKYLDILYSSPTRDKFRVRLEHADDGKVTDLYLTHYGVEEVAVGSAAASASNTYVWQRRPADPELEAEMLNRLTAYLGASEKRAENEQNKATTASTSGPRTQLTEQNGESQLLVEEDYSRAWRLVGLALDSSNYVVEEQNRGQGLYVVEYRDPEEENLEAEGEKGFFSRLAFWRSKPEKPAVGTRYRIRLAGQGSRTVVVVRSSDDQPDSSAGAKQVLAVLQQAIK